VPLLRRRQSRQIAERGRARTREPALAVASAAERVATADVSVKLRRELNSLVAMPPPPPNKPHGVITAAAPECGGPPRHWRRQISWSSESPRWRRK